MKRDLAFQQSVFQRERLKAGWPDFNRIISRGEEVAAAFEAVTDLPMWRDDPRMADVPRRAAREVLDLYNEVIADGRFVGDFVEDPAAVARKLDLKVSPQALDVISNVAARMVGSRASVGAAIAVISVSVVAVAVTTAIVSSAADPRARILVDESGMVKLGDDFSVIRQRAARRRQQKGRPPEAKAKKKKAIR